MPGRALAQIQLINPEISSTHKFSVDNLAQRLGVISNSLTVEHVIQGQVQDHEAMSRLPGMSILRIVHHATAFQPTESRKARLDKLYSCL